MAKLGIEYHDCHCVGTSTYAVDGQYAGHIVISDVVKPHSKEAIAQLKKAGVAKTIMLTGDAKRVAESVAAELGVDEVRSELLPADKVAQVEKLLAAKGKNEQLAFVGDGINECASPGRAPTSASRWAPWAVTLPSRPQMLCSWTTTRSRSQRPSRFRASASAS